MSGIRVRRGFRIPFSQVPEALLDREESGVTDRACRLWGLLDRYADAERTAWPSRRTLARRLECSVDSLDRAIRELEAAGWLHVERRVGRDGIGNESSLYTILDPSRSDAATSPQESGEVGRTAAATPSRSDAAQNDSQGNETPPTPQGGPRRWKVGGKVVTASERELAVSILAEFNRQADTRYASEEHLRPIIARLREHPQFDLAAHGRLIRAQLAEPWWHGRPGPQVIYGNAAQFERVIETARAAKQRTPLTAVAEQPRLTRDEATLRDLRAYLAAAPPGERAQVEADIASVEARIEAAARRAS